MGYGFLSVFSVSGWVETLGSGLGPAISQLSAWFILYCRCWAKHMIR